MPMVDGRWVDGAPGASGASGHHAGATGHWVDDRWVEGDPHQHVAGASGAPGASGVPGADYHGDSPGTSQGAPGATGMTAATPVAEAERMTATEAASRPGHHPVKQDFHGADPSRLPPAARPAPQGPVADKK